MSSYEHLKSYGLWQQRYAAWFNAVFRIGGMDLLDVGTAYGAHVKAYREVGCYAWGCDKEAEFIRNSPFGDIKRFLFVWDVREKRNVGFSEFDIVVSHALLEHLTVEELQMAIPNMLDCLHKGGLMVHIVTVEESPDWAKYGDPDHKTIEPISWWRDFFGQFPMIDLYGFFEYRIKRAEKEIWHFRQEYGWGIFTYEKR